MKHRNRSKRAPQRHLAFATLRSLSAQEISALFDGSDEAAARWLNAGAKYGLVEAQTLLGQVLLDGRGVPRDPKAAFRWFVIAGEAGHPPAMNMVGRCHEHGWGTSIDLAAAARWYRLAAEASLDWGQYNLANLLLRGHGVPLDRRAALDWYLRAARQGHAKSMNLVGRFYEEGWEVPADREAAFRWYERAAKGGDYRAQYNVAAWLMDQGRTGEAVNWFRKALTAATPDILQAMVATLQASGDADCRRIGCAAADRLRASYAWPAAAIAQ